MNINIEKAIVRKMAKDERQHERPLVHLISGIFREAEKESLTEDVLDAINIAVEMEVNNG